MRMDKKRRMVYRRSFRTRSPSYAARIEDTMGKIRLALEELDVQSFATAEAACGRGTVQGAEGPDQDVVGPATVTQPPRCYVESGMCLGTRFDDICDTSYCFSVPCEPETGTPCVIVTGDGCQIDTLFPGC